MLVKHIVVAAMIALGFWFNAVKRVSQNLRSVPGDAQRRARFRRHIDVMTLCGVLVLTLTALAQIEQCVQLHYHSQCRGLHIWHSFGYSMRR
jgi:putative copper export protein